jgi:diguanylate cyclase
MINDLFINSLILISFTFVGGSVLKELPYNFKESLLGKVLMGIIGGSLGILMIFYNINVESTTTILDLRALAILMINYVGGIIPALITAAIITVFRLTINGLNQSSIVAILMIISQVITFNIVDNLVKHLAKRWFFKLLGLNIISVCGLTYLLISVNKFYEILIVFVLTTSISGTLEYFLLEYVRKSNKLFNMYKEGASKDYLTGLNNTRSFDLLINTAFQNAIENKEKLACLMIDIDHFKKVNDTYGHAIGDVVLRELAEVLNRCCRSFDIIGRVGGEEFCVMLLDCHQERAIEIGTRIKNAVKEHNFPIGEDKYINITVSIGAATYPDSVDCLEDIMKQADDALYVAKRSGRDRVCNNDRCFIL